MLAKLWTIFGCIYLASGFLYLSHCLIVWRKWSWATQQTKKPWWIRSNMCWMMAGSGYFPLTNGRIVSHAVIAVMPVFNTAFVACQLGYLAVDAVCNVWSTYIQPKFFGKAVA